MERINAGNYDYLIMSRETEDSQEGEYGEFWYPIYEWVKGDPALKKKFEEPEIVPQPDYVFKVEGKLSPKYCPSPRQEEEFEEQLEVEEAKKFEEEEKLSEEETEAREAEEEEGEEGVE
jgi:hypothetical protein